MNRSSARIVLGSMALALTGCTFTSTSDQWNGRIGPNGKPVYVKSQTEVGVNFLIFVPFLGATSLPEQIRNVTSEIAAENGNTVRMVESSVENYWYGFSPFTWIITPVVTTVAAEYEPTAKQIADDEAKRKQEG